MYKTIKMKPFLKRPELELLKNSSKASNTLIINFVRLKKDKNKLILEP